MSSTTVLINTDADGDFAYERPFFGLVNAVQFKAGTLDTAAILITVTDATRDETLVQFGEIDGDAYYQPDPPFPVYGNLGVTVSAGGDSLHGSVRLMTTT